MSRNGLSISDILAADGHLLDDYHSDDEVCGRCRRRDMRFHCGGCGLPAGVEGEHHSIYTADRCVDCHKKTRTSETAVCIICKVLSHADCLPKFTCLASFLRLDAPGQLGPDEDATQVQRSCCKDCYDNREEEFSNEGKRAGAGFKATDPDNKDLEEVETK